LNAHPVENGLNRRQKKISASPGNSREGGYETKADEDHRKKRDKRGVIPQKKWVNVVVRFQVRTGGEEKQGEGIRAEARLGRKKFKCFMTMSWSLDAELKAGSHRGTGITQV